MRRGSSFTDMASVLGAALNAPDLALRLKEQMCVLVWDEVVGDQVAGAAQPEFVRDGCMFVTAKSSVWANELTFYKKDMISRLNKRVGAGVLKEIVFRTGRITRKKSLKSIKDNAEYNLEGIKLTAEELAKIESTSRAAGEEMYERFKSLMVTSMRIEKWKKKNGWTPCKECGVLQNTKTGICPVCITKRGY